MDLSGQIVLAYLEEDDTRRVLYRVRPLMNEQGPITPEDLEAYGEEGYLRVAPDRQEQHSFKDRMGALGSLCVIDLRDTQASLGKVRPNKNYQPGRGETNRYIVYSDAVKALPRDLVYEVVTGANSVKALTGLYYLREGGRISGPHCPDNSLSCPDSQVLMPDCERLFLVEMPDHSSRMFYWPLREETPPQQAMPRQAMPEEPAPGQDGAPSPDFQPSPEQPTAEAARLAAPVPALALQEQFAMAAAQLHRVLSLSGFDISPPQAAHLLLLCLLSCRLQLVGDNLADARYAALTLLGLLPDGQAAMDTQVVNDEGLPLQLMYSDSSSMRRRIKRYLASPWPVVRLFSARGIPDMAPDFERLDLGALRAGLSGRRPPLSLQDEARLGALYGRLSHEGCALPLQLRARMADYLGYSAQLSQLEEESAFDLALRAYALPYLQARGYGDEEISELLDIENL